METQFRKFVHLSLKTYNNKKRNKIYLLSSIVFLGFLLRIYNLGQPSLWFDEACSFYRVNAVFLIRFRPCELPLFLLFTISYWATGPNYLVIAKSLFVSLPSFFLFFFLFLFFTYAGNFLMKRLVSFPHSYWVYPPMQSITPRKQNNIQWCGSWVSLLFIIL